MGSGKTLTAIASVFSQPFFPNDFLYGSASKEEDRPRESDGAAPSLVVVVAPETVIPQWIDELGHTPQFSPATLMQATTFRVMSLTAFQVWIDTQNDLPPDAVLIADEIQNIRNLSDKMREVVAPLPFDVADVRRDNVSGSAEVAERFRCRASPVRWRQYPEFGATTERVLQLVDDVSERLRGVGKTVNENNQYFGLRARE